MLAKREEGKKIMDEFKLQKFKNKIFDTKRVAPTPLRKQTLQTLFGTQIKISHAKEEKNEYAKCGQQDGKSHTQR